MWHNASPTVSGAACLGGLPGVLHQIWRQVATSTSTLGDREPECGNEGWVEESGDLDDLAAFDPQ